MTHFGILCPASDGHLNPMTTLGSELLHRGHRVTVFGFSDAKEKTLAAGLEFQPLGEDMFPAGSMAEGLSQLGKLSGLAAFRYTINAFTQMATMILAEAPDALKKASVEALLVDQASLEGGTIAECLNLPFITVCSALVLHRDTNVPPFCTTWQYSPSWKGRLRNRFAYQLLSLVAKRVRKVIAEYRHK